MLLIVFKGQQYRILNVEALIITHLLEDHEARDLRAHFVLQQLLLRHHNLSYSDVAAEQRVSGQTSIKDKLHLLDVFYIM